MKLCELLKVKAIKALSRLCGNVIYKRSQSVYKINLENLYCDLTLIFTLLLEFSKVPWSLRINLISPLDKDKR